MLNDVFQGAELCEEPQYVVTRDVLYADDTLLVSRHLRNVEILLGRLRNRLADREITLQLTEAARRHLTEVGYDPVYGARPLKRVLQRELETQLGRRILASEVTDGSAVVVDYREGELVFGVEAAERAA